MALNCTCAPQHAGNSFPNITVLIPAYGAAEKLRVCLQSLVRHATDGMQVLVLDDATPDNSVRDVCAEITDKSSLIQYVRSEQNRGFVATCNWGRSQHYTAGDDLLLLNSDTEVTEGALQEMQEVLYLAEKHAVVTPRSNNSTIYSVPFAGDRLPPDRSIQVWKRLHKQLRRYEVMPTAVGFCMLIRHDILNRFELFDEIYSPGYNEENDFVCRINRYGYSAVAANWAYVFHYETSSFGPRRAALEAKNRQVLLKRFPEYPRKVSEYLEYRIDPVEHFARLYDPHRPRLLYDLFHVSPHHNGTSEFALNLLRELYNQLNDEMDVHVGIRGDSLKFFSPELRGYTIYEDSPGSDLTFDLAFKPSQIFFWEQFERMNRLSPRVSFTLQDIIGVRCEYLNTAYREILFRKVAELSDHIFTISEFSADDFRAYYGLDVPMEVIYHGTSATYSDGRSNGGEHLLLMGNFYAHKGVEDAIAYLDGELPVIVLGSDGKNAPTRPNVRYLPSGSLTRQYIRNLFTSARLVVYPSYYEGFGLPVLDALAFGKPVIVLESAVNCELEALARDSNLHKISCFQELQAKVREVLHREPLQETGRKRSWCDAAAQYADRFRHLLEQDFDSSKVRARWDLFRTMRSSLVTPS